MQTKHLRTNSQFCKAPSLAGGLLLSFWPYTRLAIFLLGVVAFINIVRSQTQVAVVKGPAIEHIKGVVRLKYVADAKAYGEVRVFDREWKDRNVPDSRKPLIKVPAPKFIPLPHRK